MAYTTKEFNTEPKTCKQCGQAKDLDCFYQDKIKGRKPYIHKICKQCQKLNRLTKKLNGLDKQEWLKQEVAKVNSNITVSSAFQGLVNLSIKKDLLNISLEWDVFTDGEIYIQFSGEGLQYGYSAKNLSRLIKIVEQYKQLTTTSSTKVS